MDVAVATDELLADFQDDLHLIFARARALLKEQAIQVHPELRPSGYKLLNFIVQEGSANAYQLAELFEMDRSVVSRQTRMLEELGLLASRPDIRDGRVRVITATASAQKLLAGIKRDHTARIRGALAELTPEEIAAATMVFRLLTEI